MSHVGDTENHLAEEEWEAGEALGGTLSLADTLEEDRERYRDVIDALAE